MHVYSPASHGPLKFSARFVMVASRLLRVLPHFATFCKTWQNVAKRAATVKQARAYVSHFVALNHGTSQHVTVYRPGAPQRVAFYYGLTRPTRSGRVYMKPVPASTIRREKTKLWRSCEEGQAMPPKKSRRSALPLPVAVAGQTNLCVVPVPKL